MFTHPAILKELNALADFLRLSGEGEWSRRVVLASDEVRKEGWTASGAQALRRLFDSDPSLHQVSFGKEHERWLPAGFERANGRMERHRLKLRDLALVPVVEKEKGPRKRSPDLEP